MKVKEYIERLEAVMIAKVPRKKESKKKDKDGEKIVELLPWSFVASRMNEGAAEIVFRTPIGYSVIDLEKQSDAFYASCGAPVEFLDYAGAVLIRVLLENFPLSIPYEEKFLELVKGTDILIGFDRQGAPLIHSLRVPHMLIGGQSGYGKTDLERWLLLQLVHNNSPEEVEIWIVDLKGFSFLPFKGIPHITRIVRDLAGANLLLSQAVAEMERRSSLIWDSQNREQAEHFKSLFILIDEAYMISPGIVAKEERELAMACDSAAAKISGTGREAKIGLLYCTQRPDATVINPLVKANMDCSIAFRTKTESNSIIILDEPGAEKLPHKKPGRVLYSSDELKEVQVPYIGNDEAWKKILEAYKHETEGNYFDTSPGGSVILDGASGAALYEQWEPIQEGERVINEIGEGKTFGESPPRNRKNKTLEAFQDWTGIFKGK